MAINVGDSVRFTVHTIGRSEVVVARVIATERNGRPILTVQHDTWGVMCPLPRDVELVEVPRTPSETD